MESTAGRNPCKIELRYFPLRDGYAYCQLSTALSGSEYQSLTGIVPGQELIQSNKKKGRAMILCLDKSGSMAGRPFEALK
jgi:hypothetical protein